VNRLVDGLLQELRADSRPCLQVMLMRTALQRNGLFVFDDTIPPPARRENCVRAVGAVVPSTAANRVAPAGLGLDGFRQSDRSMKLYGDGLVLPSVPFSRLGLLSVRAARSCLALDSALLLGCPMNAVGMHAGRTGVVVRSGLSQVPLRWHYKLRVYNTTTFLNLIAERTRHGSPPYPRHNCPLAASTA
jgi:hypothetical protein